MRNVKCVCIIAFLHLCIFTSAQTLNRGIGVYPGDPAEYKGPQQVADETYRNLALLRTATASSSLDRNLTAQLITDGICDQELKGISQLPFITVWADGQQLFEGEVLKTLDRNIYTYNLIRSEEGSIVYHWTGMSPRIDCLRLAAEVVYRPELAGGYSLTVEQSADGDKWTVVYSEKADTLPGVASQRMVSSDPDKRDAVERLPQRMLIKDIKIPDASYSYLRILTSIPGLAYMRIIRNDMLCENQDADVLPQDRFCSAWVSKGDADEWVEIDLGAEAEIEKVVPHWIAEPAHFDVNIRDNRFVRISMSGGNPDHNYALSEVEVWGRGGVKPSDTCWKVQRVGDSHWLSATVPGTVLSSYMNAGALPDNRYSDNMAQISESYFNSDFLYRHTLNVPADYNGKRIYLNFDGINWKAEISLNGKYAGRIDGAFMRGRFDITELASIGDNLLEVKVVHNANYNTPKIKNRQNTGINGGLLGRDNPTFHASVGWDWITTVPGREVGIWNDVWLSADEGISLSDPLFTTRLNDRLQASVTPSVFVRNSLPTPQSFTLCGKLGNIDFQKNVTIAANTVQEVAFCPDEFPQLKDQNLRLWWPNGYGEPYLYDAEFSIIKKCEIDKLSSKVGIREMSYSDLDSDTQIYINHRRFNPLGGNWGFPEINLNYRAREYDIAVAYHKEMNCNIIRNWVGQTGDREFYEACDRHGILVWQDFWLANPSDGPDPEDEEMFLRNSADYIKRIRQHACVGIYVGRNEGFPPESIDRMLRQQIDSLHPGLAYIPSSADGGVSGHGPYNLLASEEYFIRQPKKIHSERGLPNIPTYESLQRMLAPEHLWPQSEQWGKHDFTLMGAQRGKSFNELMEQRFGRIESAEEFCRLAQLLNYDGYRAMYEGSQQYRRGLIIWMSHSCWPSMVWDTYDYYFEPTAAFFGVKKACEPLHVQYNPLRKTAEVVNMHQTEEGLELRAEILDTSGHTLWHYNTQLDAAGDATTMATYVVPPTDRTTFIRLYLSKDKELISDNFYISYGTEGLPHSGKKPEPILNCPLPEDGCITVKNNTDSPLLFIRLNLLGSDGKQILPVHYSDNYFSLMPGESRKVTVTYSPTDARGQKPRVVATPSL